MQDTHEYQLQFMHPNSGVLFPATFEGEFSVEEILQTLQSVGFIAPNEQGYQLFWEGQALADRQRLSALASRLYEGAVFLVRPRPVATKTTANEHATLLYMQHPSTGALYPFYAQPNWTLESVVEMLIQKGFLDGYTGDFVLNKSGTPLGIESSVLEAGLSDGDVVRIASNGGAAGDQSGLQAMLKRISTQLSELKTNPSSGGAPAGTEGADSVEDHYHETPHEPLEIIVKRILNQLG